MSIVGFSTAASRVFSLQNEKIASSHQTYSDQQSVIPVFLFTL